MNKGWETKKLGEVCSFENGDRGANYPSKAHRTINGIPFINAGHLTRNGIDVDNMDYISRDRFNLLGSGKIQKYDILFCLRGSLGKYAQVKEFSEGAIASSLVIVRPKNSLSPSILTAYFESSICAKMIKKFSNGAAQPNLSAGNLKNFEIPIPPLPEQQRIVAILDEAFAAIEKAKANAEQNLKNVKELFDNYLDSIFVNNNEEWDKMTLSEVCVLNPPKKEARDKLLGNDLVTFLPMEDLGILNKNIIGNKVRYLKDVIGSYTYFANNDVLLAKITPCFENGKIGIAGNLKNGIGFGSSEYNVFRSKGKVVPDFLYYFLSRQKFRVEGKLLMSGAVGHKRVSKDWIEKKIVNFPTTQAEQRTIVQKLDALFAKTKKLEAIYKKKIEDLEELKKSILQKAFNGELNTTKAVAV